MIIFEVESTTTARREGVKNGKPWAMVTQQVLIHGTIKDGFVARYPRDTTVQLDDKNPQPYPVGKYVLGAESYYFGEYDRFIFGRISLQPLAAFTGDLEKQLGMKFQSLKAA